MTNDGEVTNYSWGTVGTDTTVTVTDNDGTDAVVVTDPAVGRPVSVTNASGNPVTYEYYPSGLLKKVTLPEGNYIYYDRDDRGNAFGVYHVPKDPLVDPTITTLADYDTTCTDTVTCNKPNYIIDPNGNRTDYTLSLIHI